MNNLEQAKKRLAEYKDKQTKFLREIKEIYDKDNSYEYEDAIKNAIGDDIILEWNEQRDAIYICDTVECQEMLVKALEMLEKNDKKSLHNAKKVFEDLVHDARQIKKARTHEIQQAQNVIDAMNEIIKICDENRK